MKGINQLASHYAEVLGARLTPVLTAVREEAVGGQYALVLEFVRRTRVSDLRHTHMARSAVAAVQSHRHAGCQCCRKRHIREPGLLYCQHEQTPIRAFDDGRASTASSASRLHNIIVYRFMPRISYHLQVKPAMTLEMWTDRLDRIQSFFGPGIRAEVGPCIPPSPAVQANLITPVFLLWLE